MNARVLACATVGIAIGYLSIANAEQPSPPCHPNPNAAADRQTVATRADVTQLPQPLQAQLVRLADRPHTYLPLQVFAEADKPSQLFQYYLLSTDGFEPNIFTAIIPGINDSAIPTAANAANGQRPTFGAVRVALEPKPGLPTDPHAGASFIDTLSDISVTFGS